MFKHFQTSATPKTPLKLLSAPDHPLSHPEALSSQSFPIGDFNSVIIQQRQQIIPDLHLQLRGSILSRVHNVSTPSSLGSYKPRWISQHTITTIKCHHHSSYNKLARADHAVAKFMLVSSAPMYIGRMEHI